jgi:hypothetical protein
MLTTAVSFTVLSIQTAAKLLASGEIFARLPTTSAGMKSHPVLSGLHPQMPYFWI